MYSAGERIISNEAVADQAAGRGLSVRNLSVTMEGHRILSEISLNVQPGEILGLVGESGGGKTTLLSSCIGTLPGQARVDGSIFLNGRRIDDLPEREYRRIRGSEIGMIFQDPETSFAPTVTIRRHGWDVLRRMPHMSRSEGEDRLIDTFLKLGLTDTDRILKSYPHELSGGMKQRISAALSVLQAPGILLADEPTASLDVISSRKLIEMLCRIRDDMGIGIIVSTHNIAGLMYMADRIAVISEGCLVESGSTDAILHAPSHPQTIRLIEAVRSRSGGGVV